MRNDTLRSDLPWAMLYRDGLPVVEIATKLGVPVSNLLPELTEPVAAALKGYQQSLDKATRRQG